MKEIDLLIVGAGPAGMASAIEARRLGLAVRIIDEQPTPGGQIWRSVENTVVSDRILGPSYTDGRAVVDEFGAMGGIYQPESQVWQIEPGLKAYLRSNGSTEVVEAGAIVLATGAQERAIPFPGWTLPGVMTVGAAQILLKNAGQIPERPVWIAGSGPLLLLYAVQLLRAGGTIAGILDTTPVGLWKRAWRHLPRALGASGQLLDGLRWIAALKNSGIQIINGVTQFEALGTDKLSTLRYRTKNGASNESDADILLVHEGIVPNIHPSLSMGCGMEWDTQQEYFYPILDEWGESSVSGVFVAGDAAGIAGAEAALLKGQLTAIRIAANLGRLDESLARRRAAPIRRQLRRKMAARPLLDAIYKPRRNIFDVPDDTIVCRCEEVAASSIRKHASVGRPGPNQVKAATRAGMGPCQGRQCGYAITGILAATQFRSPADVGFFHIRPPLKPITIADLASLADAE